MRRRLFDKFGCYTEEGIELSREMNKLALSFFKKYNAKQVDLRDLNYIIAHCLDLEVAFTCLQDKAKDVESKRARLTKKRRR